MRKSNIQDTKLSIIGGIIGLVILLLFGDNYINRMDYSENLNPYEKVINMKIPDNAFRVESSCYGFVEDEYKWEYNLFIANFTSKDGNKFLDSIKKSNKWILSTEVDSKYKDTLPVKLKVNDDTYIYKYDESNNEENVFVKAKGKNYIFTYDVSTNHIKIHEYTLSSRRK